MGKCQVVTMIQAYLFQILLHAVFSSINADSWLGNIREEFGIIFLLVWFFVGLLVLAVVLYLGGLIVVGGKRALFSDAFIISLLGMALSTIFFLFIPHFLIFLLLSIFVWLLLIKRLYKTSWLRAIAVGILAIIIFFVVIFLLALTFNILDAIMKRFSLFMILML
jgi:hypothetical protein